MFSMFITTSITPISSILVIFPQNNLEELLILGTVFVILLAVGIYLILNIRKTAKNDEHVTDDEILLRFSKLFDEGKLTREEYRQIKLQFAEKLKRGQNTIRITRPSSNSPPSKKGRKKKKRKPSSSDSSSALQSLLAPSDEHQSTESLPPTRAMLIDRPGSTDSPHAPSQSLPVPPVLPHRDDQDE